MKLRASAELTDVDGVKRKTGDEWLVRKTGAYLPALNEEIVDLVKARVITERTAIHLSTERTFTDVYGKVRKAGEEWLITSDIAEFHIIDIFEIYSADVEAIVLTETQYCFVLDPRDSHGVN